MNSSISPANGSGRFLTAPLGIDHAIALLRIWLGTVLITHGIGKVFGGIDKFSAGVESLGFPMPEVFAWSAALTEFVGGILLILGLGTRVTAILVAITMAVAGFLRHADDPFAKKELAFTYLVLSIVVFLIGPGRYSVDAMLARTRTHRHVPASGIR